MSGDKCEEQVGDPPGYWHWRRCTRRAKYVATKDDKRILLCGQHSKLHTYREFVLAPVETAGA